MVARLLVCRWLLAPALLLPTMLVPLPAQAWHKLLPTRHAAIVYDAGNARCMLFEDQDTWLYAGDRWTPQRTATTPPAREYHAMAHDRLRGRTVLFGGWTSSGQLGDTWEHDGSNWVRIVPPVSPSARAVHAMTYDLARGRTILFGGSASSSGPTGLADTWEWDGTVWLQRATPTTPPPRRLHAVAYDEQRQRTVLFGGASFTTFGTLRNDTWEYDGNDWTQRFPANVPAVRQGHALAYDPVRGRTLMFGGGDGALASADTWEYDGTDWIPRYPAVVPPARQVHAMAYDVARARTVRFGGAESGSLLVADTWEYDGSAWVRTVGAPTPIRSHHAMAQDDLRARTVLFGGADSYGILGADTWEFDGVRWTQIVTAQSPQLRAGHCLAYDGSRGRTVLFGGLGASPTADTWEYDGAWHPVATPVAPPARHAHALAYDAARGRIVLFGGNETGSYFTGGLADTWEYDGATWTQRNPPATPPARRMHAMAYDAANGRCVLFGGLAANTETALGDTWTFDGSTWLQVTTANAPLPRHSAAMTFDRTRGRIVLLGGYGAGFSVDAWEFDGAGWTALPIAQPPVYSPVLVHDNRRDRLVLVGSGLTMEFVAAPAASIARYGPGCAGSAGTPVLGAPPGAVPALGTTLSLQLGALPPAPGLAVLAFGFDRTQWLGVPLPMALDAVGLPGCRAWVPPEFWLLLPTNGGSASHGLGIPAAPWLAGLTLGAQALSFDAAAAGGIGAVSNGIVLRLY